MSRPEEMSCDELIAVVRRQTGQISAQAGQSAELMEAAPTATLPVVDAEAVHT